MKLTKTFVVLFIYHVSMLAQTNVETILTPLPGEKWWGGFVGMGSNMPFSGTTRLFDLSKENMNNQNVPLLVSSAGRYIWSDDAFSFRIENGSIHIYASEKAEAIQAGKNLREAYLTACKNHFPPSGKLPAFQFFTMPQYNTWIELVYNQNQKDILKYATDILEHDFPTGVFMIDDNWQKYYGNFEFKPDRFLDPKSMVDELHKKGFRVMLWICPFVSPDSPEYRELRDKGYLIKDKSTKQPAIITWWNGKSASYDLSNPEAAAHLIKELQNVQQKYGIDGFKFDAGDIAHYNNPDLLFHAQQATPGDMSTYWAKIGLNFPFNEYRACWRMGGEALVQRLGDKNYSWGAVKLLVPEMIAAGLLGYAFTCPDMIGGGQFGTFINIDQTKLNQKLIVRSCQVHALMPMMQFSVAPWRVLNQENLEICKKYSYLHNQFAPYIIELAEQAAQTGEPIVRHMEYVFPNQGFSECKDQFMLGDKYLVAPVMDENDTRKIVLPKGIWKDDQGKTIKGPVVLEVTVPLDRLPYYERIKK